jgi:hypothetical protein
MAAGTIANSNLKEIYGLVGGHAYSLIGAAKVTD